MKKWSGFLGKPHLGHSDFWTLPLTNRGPWYYLGQIDSTTILKDKFDLK